MVRKSYLSRILLPMTDHLPNQKMNVDQPRKLDRF